MKKLLGLGILAVVFGFIGAVESSAQTTPAKDLYIGSNSSTTGNQGAKVGVLLKRGDQAERIVSTNETFYSGDKIKLVLDINFSGYAAIINTGSSRKQNLLFPYFDSSDRLVSHQVSPNAGTQLPRGNDWIVFDDKPGSEQVTVIFSKKPIVELNNYEQSVTQQAQRQQPATNGSTGIIAGEAEADGILTELNSKSLAQSKDLSTQTSNDGTYGVVRNGLGSEPVAFTFFLKHK